MKRFIWACALLLASSAIAADAEISASELEARIRADDAPFVLDVRTASEFAQGRVPGAVNVPYDEVRARLAEIADQRDREVVVYCRSGKRAAKAADVLSEEGFQVLHLTGDMNGWEASGYPVEKGD